MAFAPDGRRVLCGGMDRALRLWELGTGHSLGVLHGHATGVHAVAFAPDGRQALSGSGGSDAGSDRDDSIRVWELPF